MSFTVPRIGMSALVTAGVALSGVVAVGNADPTDNPATQKFPLHCSVKSNRDGLTGIYRGNNGVSLSAETFGVDYVEEGGAAVSYRIVLGELTLPKTFKNADIKDLSLDIAVPITLKVSKAHVAGNDAALPLSEVNGIQVITVSDDTFQRTEAGDKYTYKLPEIHVDSKAVKTGRVNFYFRPGTVDLYGTKTYKMEHSHIHCVLLSTEPPVTSTYRLKYSAPGRLFTNEHQK
ncbi:hypothetical protein ACQXY3_08770 [Corynebacterium diphtheriae]|uniref:hypothetical protein n=1 Tax=Corynebacterium diphtheriae TaxID=1717 RepID=UPI000246926C|nr:hypothetical protein [Corynebacterium diphtheriae]AEX79672.1 putative secreted protein [Corynebacterium diphtheriae HC03]KJJ59069.1 hypothetical protein NG01_09860 [Corynebacterium diphtheriae]CAB0570954.1 hypothetical protein CIP107518_02046 [Corynebacterium diphtheriae]CAB0616194.1 hypothetical protein CIP107550_02030 [Corynebacterium diphtheriae]CAB0758932.1 hypothetical protein FRC0135_01882 [Corynebacterium diphtheriae]